jgi:capsular exopolysaccharide synthesis family protein
VGTGVARLGDAGYQDRGPHLARPYAQARQDQLDIRRQVHVVRKHLWVVAVMSLITAAAAVFIGLRGDPTLVGRVTVTVRRDAFFRVSSGLHGFLSEETVAANLTDAVKRDEEARKHLGAAGLAAAPKGINQVVVEISTADRDVIDVVAERVVPAVSREFAALLKSEIKALERVREARERDLVGATAEIEKHRRCRLRVTALESLLEAQLLDVESLTKQKAKLKDSGYTEGPARALTVDEQTRELKRRTLVGDIVKLQIAEAELRERYHSGHPRMVNTRDRLKELRKELKGLKPPPPGRGGDLGALDMKLLESEARAKVLGEHLAKARADAAGAERKEVAGQVRSTVLRQDVIRLGDRISRLEAVRSTAPVEKTGEVHVAEPAGARQRLARTVPFGLILGVVMGVLFALGLEHMRDTCSSPGEVFHDLGLPTLAIIPRLPEGSETCISSVAPHSELAETFSILRNNLRYSAPGTPQKLIMVTSPLAGDGKSMIVANLAISYSFEGLNVLLIDADLRRSRGHADLALPPSPGLVDWLEGAISHPEEAIVASREPGLFVLPSGGKAANATKLVSSPRMGELLKWAEQYYDVVIVDTPAVLPVADTTIFANLARAVALIIDSSRTRSGIARAALSRLSHVRGNVVGVVLNKADHRSLGYMSNYGAKYSYGYRYDTYAGDP